MSDDDILSDLRTVSAYDMAKIENLYAEQAKRRVEALNLYEPMPWQDAYHRCRSKEAVVCKAVQAGGPTPSDTPVLTPDGWVNIGDLSIGDFVIGGDGKACRVISVTDQGWLPVFNLEFDDQTNIRCSEGHLWKVLAGKNSRWPKSKYFKPNNWQVWTLQKIREYGGDTPKGEERVSTPIAVAEFAYRHVPIAPYTLGVLLGDGSISQDVASFTTSDAEISWHVAKELPAGYSMRVSSRDDNGKASAYHIRCGSLGGKPTPFLQGLRDLRLMGCRSEDKFIPHEYLFNSVDVRVALLQGLMDTDGYCDADNGVPYFYSCSPQLCKDVIHLVRSLGGKARFRWKETFITVKKPRKRGAPFRKQIPSEDPKSRCLHMGEVSMTFPKDMPIFRLERKQERRKQFEGYHFHGRCIETIKADGNAKCFCIGVDSPDHTYITKDFIVTHNSLAGFVEDARAVTNSDPYKKYPNEGVLVCCGYGERHIGRVIHRYLFRPGAFRIIKDLDTGAWRTFRPWKGVIDDKLGDAGREKESKNAPPLIPKRFIEKISWEKRSDFIFSSVTLNTGWLIYAYNTAGDPEQAQGFAADLAHFDEDTQTPGWYREMTSRCAIREGKLRWTALPHNKNEEMQQLISRAEEDASLDSPRAAIFTATMFQNIYYPEASRIENARIWMSEGREVYEQRALGKTSMSNVLMYHTFDPQIHDATKLVEPRLRVQEILAQNNMVPPADWTRYYCVDPGHTVCAILYGATPPPSVGDHRIIYAESYIRNCDATMFGNAAKETFSAEPCEVQRFIIDAHGGALREIGTGITPRRQYESALRSNRVTTIDCGHGFRDGCDDVKGREIMLREWLRIRGDGTTKLLIIVGKCPNLVREMRGFKKKVVKVNGVDTVIDEGNRKANTHAVEALEMLAADGMEYIRPRRKSISESYVDRVLRQRKHFEAAKRAKGVGYVSNSITLGPRGSRS